MTDAEGIIRKFAYEVIRDKNDTKNDYWKRVTYVLIAHVGKDSLQIQLLSPLSCIISVLRTKLEENPNTDILKTLDDVENSFYCLSQYALNMCREPQRKEYNILKTYTGYYTCNISTVLNGHDRPILESMGYTVREDCENEDEFVLTHVNQHIEKLAFELFLSQSYCQKIKEICKQALDLKYNAKEVITVLERYTIRDIEVNGVIKYCELQKNLVKISDDSVPAPHTPAIYEYSRNERLVPENDPDDDDLYGSGGPASSSENYFTTTNTTTNNNQFVGQSDAISDNISHVHTTGDLRNNVNTRQPYSNDSRSYDGEALHSINKINSEQPRSVPHSLSSNINHGHAQESYYAAPMKDYKAGNVNENTSPTTGRRQNQTASHVTNEGGKNTSKVLSESIKNRHGRDNNKNQTASYHHVEHDSGKNMSKLLSESTKNRSGRDNKKQNAATLEEDAKYEEMAPRDTGERVPSGTGNSVNSYERVTAHGTTVQGRMQKSGQAYNPGYIHGTENKGFTDRSEDNDPSIDSPYTEGIILHTTNSSQTDDAAASSYDPSNVPRLYLGSNSSAAGSSNLYSSDDSSHTTNNTRQTRIPKSSPADDASTPPFDPIRSAHLASTNSTAASNLYSNQEIIHNKNNTRSTRNTKSSPIDDKSAMAYPPTYAASLKTPAVPPPTDQQYSTVRPSEQIYSVPRTSEQMYSVPRPSEQTYSTLRSDNMNSSNISRTKSDASAKRPTSSQQSKSKVPGIYGGTDLV